MEGQRITTPLSPPLPPPPRALHPGGRGVAGPCPHSGHEAMEGQRIIDAPLSSRPPTPRRYVGALDGAESSCVVGVRRVVCGLRRGALSSEIARAACARRSQSAAPAGGARSRARESSGRQGPHEGPAPHGTGFFVYFEMLSSEYLAFGWGVARHGRDAHRRSSGTSLSSSSSLSLV